MLTYQRIWTAVQLILYSKHSRLLGLSKNRLFRLVRILLLFLLEIFCKHSHNKHVSDIKPQTPHVSVDSTGCQSQAESSTSSVCWRIWSIQAENRSTWSTVYSGRRHLRSVATTSNELQEWSLMNVALAILVQRHGNFYHFTCKPYLRLTFTKRHLESFLFRLILIVLLNSWTGCILALYKLLIVL